MPATTEPRPPTLPSVPGRLSAVDVLRGIAVLLVLGRHVQHPEHGVPSALGPLLAAWRQCGWIGVDLFFVLSGFLVGGLLFREHREHGRVRVARFLGRRGFKIYPGFYALLAFSVVWAGAHVPASAFAAEALFVQNYSAATVWNHTWSLAVEEHFYLALALLLGWASRDASGSRMRAVPVAVAGVCATVLALRVTTWCTGSHDHLLFPTHLRLDALAAGTALAWAWHFHRERTLAFAQRRRAPLAAFGALLVAPSLVLQVEGSAFVNTFGLTANYIGFACVLLAALARPAANATVLRSALARVGFHSYSIYLWHMPVLKLVMIAVEPAVGHGAAIVLYLAGSLAVGIAFAWCLELPMLALRDRLLPATRAQASGSSTAGDAQAAGEPMPAR